MMIILIKYFFLFITGATLGWIIELIYRRFWGKARKWINPGFLTGPYLPLYGTGVCILYLISDLNIIFATKVLCYCVAMTLIELVTGLFFLKFYNMRLWDYSNSFLNYKGIICPLYSFFWTILSLVFYFLLYPYFYSKVEFLYSNLEFSFFIGIFLGFIIVDCFNAFSISNKLKHIRIKIDELEQTINLDTIRLELRNKFSHLQHQKFTPSFFNPFSDIDLKQYIKDKFEK